jgi:hypothetical protein
MLYNGFFPLKKKKKLLASDSTSLSKIVDSSLNDWLGLNIFL